MTVYTPKRFSEEIEHGVVCSKTIINWIKSNKIVGYKGVSRVETTPSGRYKIIVANGIKDKVDSKFDEIMKRKFGG